MILPFLISTYISSNIPNNVCADLQQKLNTLNPSNTVIATPVLGASYKSFVGCDLTGNKQALIKAVDNVNTNKVKVLINGYKTNTAEFTYLNNVFVYVVKTP